MRIIRDADLRSVAAGPFTGMSYGPFASDKGLLPRLCGTYEKETYPAVDKIVEFNPDLIVVAGSGEGYFSVGLARLLPAAKVVAYELSRWGRYLTEQHALRNGVQVETRGFCTPQALAGEIASSRRPAIVCDIEGGESAVLDPAKVPDLVRAIILVELHPMYVEGIEGMISSRFASTHEIHMMRLGERSLNDIPHSIDGKVPSDDALWAVNEQQFRGIGLWMLLTPRVLQA